MKKLILQLMLCFSVFLLLCIFTYLHYPINSPTVYTVKDSDPQGSVPSIQNGIIRIGEHIDLLEHPTELSPGEKSRIAIQGTKNTVYDINVYYPSGASTSKAFENKTSDENGTVFWDWTLSGRTSADTVRVVIRSENAYLSFNVKVVRSET